MTDVRQVFAYLGPDHVAQGFYTLDGDKLTMVFDNGQPVMLDDAPVTETVTPEHVEAVAKKLTKRIRKAFRGELVEGFGRSALSYENEVFV
ncbi:hypothetical protein AOQ73_05820 [Bradyrhizobium pachyrhizi]|uniref:hypothetical protein n=1 Tax=Bradyrhizobium pachyrhizi TaxID=280333 RepID=UPI000704AD80|nr:hypothetical protein [Bradyrhizobium pachyrhizi]KRQ11925.1 hypothetical protein AOQ73_05820 [Bradyrhizobium pachyrhizi]